MTSASELFYKRRSDTRPDRTAGNASTSDQRLGLEYCINRHHTCRRDNILDGGDGDTVRRLLHLRHRHYRASQGHPDALPRSVVRARERLVQRLGGIPMSISSDRRSSRDAFIMGRVEYNLALEHHLAEQVSSNRVPRTGNYGTGSANRKKPPGLSQDAVDLLCSQVVCNNVSRGGKSSSGECGNNIVECSICLESLMEGDEVICLPICTHRFHSTCLTPWISTCGDCPYCRQPIITT